MPEKANNKRQLSLLLLQESLWKIEDKLNIFLESIADHEAELIRLRRLVSLVLQRLEAMESRRTLKTRGGAKNAKR